MGGRLALLLGLGRPDVFASVGALQPAIRVDEAPLFAGLAGAAMARAAIALRLVSSDDDPFLPAVRALSAKLGEIGVPHSLVVVPGPHDYAFNRGPGSAELLFFHERALRGFPP
jgi:enterochelin esterase-like enzyme